MSGKASPGGGMKRSLSYPEKMALYGHRRTKSNGWDPLEDLGFLNRRDSTGHKHKVPIKQRRSKFKQISYLLLGAVLMYCLLLWAEHRRLLGACENAIDYGFNSSEDLMRERHGPRIVIVSGAYSNVVDGVSRTLNRLVKDLNAREYQTYIIAPTRDPPALEHYGALLPAPAMKLPFRGEYSFATGLDRCVRELLEEFDPQIVHVATPDVLGQQIQRWALDRNTPVICSYHTRFNSYLPYYFQGATLDAIDTTLWWWLVKFYRNCDHVYPPTVNVQKELESKGFRNETMRIWPRGINLTSFNPSHRSPERRSSWGASEETIVILMVSRMVWEKNLHLFVDTIKYLEAAKLPIKAVLAGEGPAREEMMRMLPSATYLGHQDSGNLSVAYASADIFFFPSVTETWGSVTLEAMASGLAVVVPGGPAGSELVQDRDTGRLFDPNDNNSTYEILRELVVNKEARHKLQVAGVEKVRSASDFTWDHANQLLRGHYSEILARPPIASLVEGMMVPGALGSPGEGTPRRE